jgi:predicted NUDIX family NTP pyrophosphohydrolase
VPKLSAGLLMYRFGAAGVEVLLVHPGGPFFRRKDRGVWSIPKGEPMANEPLLDAAVREFEEELGTRPDGPFVPLMPVRQKGGKTVHAWALRGDLDTARIRCNTARVEWPPRSGQVIEFPEIDRAAFFGLEEAVEKVNPAQVALIRELAEMIQRTRR